MSQFSLGFGARLTCETCKRRKVKCDKLYPCTSCRKANFACVPVERTRLPRGRSAKTKKKRFQEEIMSHVQTPNLSSRVSMLEGLVHNLLSSQTESSLEDLNYSGSLNVGSSWSGVDTLGSGNRDASLEGTVQPAGRQHHGLNYQSTSQDHYISPNDVAPREGDESRLLQIYIMQVDPIFPFLQCSSLWAHVTQGEPYLTYAADHPAPRALVCAISYMTITTLSNDRCHQEFNSSRGLLLNKYHSLTKRALEHADYINTDDIAVLQAFVLFLVSIQAHDQSRRAWTMLSLALRIAQSLLLDISDPPFMVTPLEREMRRRLWHIISLLDVQASFNHGSAPMLQPDCLEAQIFPAIDFLDFFAPPKDNSSPFPGPSSLADPTFIMVMAEGQRAFRSLNLCGNAGLCMTSIDIHCRLQTAATFQRNSQALLKGLLPDKIPFHLFLEQLVEVTHAFLQLVAVKPVQGTAKGYFSQDIISPSTLLSLATSFLQALNNMYQDPRIEPFRWYVRLFAPWHAFSVAMDIVCACDDSSLQGYYQRLVAGLYSSLQELLQDTHRRLLQQPLHQFAMLSQTCINHSLAADSFLS
ncbi:hypothetical protein IFM53868_07737 [Aspergillus udagawae]|uniref:Zn(2)-C6 fungal-type domain-containing protein n=1 Tax=Aspergillus udagawae TaxID=91492 RepID=A0ABQ1B6S2_9EURO|nr:hypothetical protein IFM53868_07737 [Aspergillus udagawae]GFG16582.1 hypothetical protein IFM5058_08031 [Aspergillus udagawae]